MLAGPNRHCTDKAGIAAGDALHLLHLSGSRELPENSPKASISAQKRLLLHLLNLKMPYMCIALPLARLRAKKHELLAQTYLYH